MDIGNKKQIGNAITEYVVVMAVVLALLLAANANGDSTITVFLNLIGTGFDRFTGFMSLP